jgi:NADH-quinone oxidoreductase subunit J
MAQMIVYAGAIMVLFVFVIMLLNAGAEATSRQIRNFARYSGILLLAAFLGLISFIIQAMLPKTEGVVFGAFQGGTAAAIGRKLFTEYLLPFEVTSVLILIAILGAIVLARREV